MAQLFWVMLIGSAVIWAGVILLALYASRWKRRTLPEKTAGRLILWAGVVFPVLVLAGLLSFALWLMPSLRPFAGEQAKFQIEVTGHQFWWNVVYHRPDGTTVSSANEIRMPVGERVEFRLVSADMIHSFWIPALGGKMDLIPGRVNRLSLLATKPGRYRGQCAEFCGMSHALMAFPVVAMDPAEFDTWLSDRQRPSAGVAANEAGRSLFQREKCGDCHRVAGTEARGTIGPDLSNIGSRLTIGAGQMDNDAGTLARFIAHAGSVKPGSHMPAYPNLSREELDEIAIWLKALQ